MTLGRQAADRTLLRVSGTDRERFLQDLVSNDLAGVRHGLVYAALLTPQGKYLFDFMIAADGEALLIDVKSDRAQALAMRLNMYKLRADVAIAPVALAVVQVIGERPEAPICFADPRHEALGWRVYTDDPKAALDGLAPLSQDEWDRLRVRYMIPETGIELIADDSYILEAGFDRLHGVDFKKGCYVGQEVTARMRHKTELRKGLRRVRIAGDAVAGTPIENDGRVIGTLHSVAGDEGLAHLRFDRLDGPLTAGAATITPCE